MTFPSQSHLISSLTSTCTLEFPLPHNIIIQPLGIRTWISLGDHYSAYSHPGKRIWAGHQQCPPQQWKKARAKDHRTGLCWFLSILALIPVMWVQSLGQEDPLERGMTTHSSIPVWRIPWTEEPGGLQSIGLQRAGHHWSNLAQPCFLCTLKIVYDSAFPILWGMWTSEQASRREWSEWWVHARIKLWGNWEFDLEKSLGVQQCFKILYWKSQETHSLWL